MKMKMKPKLVIGLLFLAGALSAQSLSGSGIPFVTTLPTTCTPGVYPSAWIYVVGSTGTLETCTAVNTITPTSSGWNCNGQTCSPPAGSNVSSPFQFAGGLSTTSGQTADFHAGPTLPEQTGPVSAMPSACTVGQVYFATNAAAGQNEYYCTATNTWTQQSGGGSTPTTSGTSTSNLSLPISVASYGAVCSSTTASVTTTAGSSAATVGAIGDFSVGQWVKIGQAGPSNTIPTPTVTAVGLSAPYDNPEPQTAPFFSIPNGNCYTDSASGSLWSNPTCTTTYGYTTQNVGQTGIGTATNGMRSAQSAVVYVTGGPAKLSLDNQIVVSFTTDANTSGVIIRRCSGTACTPTTIVAVLTNEGLANWSSGTSTWWDWGSRYGYDEDGISGSASVPGDLNAQITAINGTSVTLSVPPSQGGTFTMRHDNAPAFQAAVNASCEAGSSYNCAPVVIPSCQYPYPLAQAVSFWGMIGSGFTTNAGAMSTAAWPVQLQWDGPIGGVVINGNYAAAIRIKGLALVSDINGHGNTAGTFLDITRYPDNSPNPSNAGPGAPASSATQVANTTNWEVLDTQCAGQVGICFRLGGDSNVDYMQFNRIRCDQGNGTVGGGVCVYSNSQETYIEAFDGVYIGSYNEGFHFKRVGSYKVTNFDFEGNVLDFYDAQRTDTGLIDSGVTEGPQYFGNWLYNGSDTLTISNVRVCAAGMPDYHVAAFGGGALIESNTWVSGASGNQIAISHGLMPPLFLNNHFASALVAPCGSYPCNQATPGGLPFDDGNGGSTTPGYMALANTVGYVFVPQVLSTSNSANSSVTVPTNNLTLVNMSLLSQSAASGSAPTVGNCGTYPSGSTGSTGTNNAFAITVGGTSAVTACAVTFSTSNPFQAAPICQFNDITAGITLKQSSLSATGVTLTTTASDMHGDIINGVCMGK